MLAYLMFKTKALLNDLEDFVAAELLRLMGMEEAAFAAAGMTVDFDAAAARFTLGNCAPDFSVEDLGARKAIWALGFESFVLESAAGRLEYTAAADRCEEELQPSRAMGTAAGS